MSHFTGTPWLHISQVTSLVLCEPANVPTHYIECTSEASELVPDVSHDELDSVAAERSIGEIESVRFCRTYISIKH